MPGWTIYHLLPIRFCATSDTNVLQPFHQGGGGLVGGSGEGIVLRGGTIAALRCGLGMERQYRGVGGCGLASTGSISNGGLASGAGVRNADLTLKCVGESTGA
jgi:hypothetical protein